MTSSRGKSVSQIVWATVLAIALGLSLCVAPANAQPSEDDTAEDSDEASGAPMGLLGSTSQNKSQNDRDDEIASDSDEPDVRALPSPPGSNATVDVGTLGGPGKEAIGLLGIQEGGFGDNMWAGSRRVVVESLLPEVPARTTSPVMRELRRRLLLSKSHDPLGESTGVSILSLRADRLYQSGLIEDALQLALNGKIAGVDAYGASEQVSDLDSDVMKVAAQVYLLRDDIRAACTQAVRVRSLSDEPFWSKLRSVCYAVAGDSEKAAFAASLLREESHSDENFFALIDHATENIPYSLDGMKDGSAIHWSLLKLIGDVFPPDSVETTDLSVISRIADTGIAGGGAAELLSLRIPAAEHAALFGAFPVDGVRALYRSAPIDDAAGIAEVTTFADSSDQTALRRAATFQAAEKTGDGVVRARFIRQALDEARANGQGALAAEIYAPMVVALPADPILQARAKDFLSILIVSGDYEAAARWFSLLERYDLMERRSGHVGEPQDVAGFRTLLALSHPFNSRTMSDWGSVTRLTQATATDDYAKAVLEVRLLDALGFFIPEDAKVLMLERPADLQGQMPQSGVLSGLDAAARAGRQAEAVLYALVALGEGGPAQAHPSAVVKVVAGLTRVGLENEAKRIAIEALLARM